MKNTLQFKQKLLNATPCYSNEASFEFTYFYNGRIIGTNDHQHFEVIGCIKLNTVYKIQAADGELNE